jgi:MtN3 and saliva related transmembrane protein
MDNLTILGLVAASLTTFAFMPQVLKIIATRETKDISLFMYLMLEAGISLWLVYGLLLWNLPLIFSNAASLTFTSIVLALKLKHG